MKRIIAMVLNNVREIVRLRNEEVEDVTPYRNGLTEDTSKGRSRNSGYDWEYTATPVKEEVEVNEVKHQRRR